MSETKQTESKQASGNAPDIEDLKAEKADLEKRLEDEIAARQAAEKLAAKREWESEKRVAAQEDMIAKQLRQQRKVRIVIASGRSASERCPVPVGVNGREFLIERDKEVDVPEGVLNALDLAVASVAEAYPADRQINTEFHKASRFSYRVLGYVDPKTGETKR